MSRAEQVATMPAPPGVLRAARKETAGRVRTVTLVLLGLAVGLALATLVWDGHASDLWNQFLGIFGAGNGEGAFTITKLRLPRVVLSVLVGVAFGLSGALFQSVLRNPLASPDIIGISGGASLAAAFGLLVLGVGGIVLSAFAFAGAIVVAAAIYLLAWRDGVSGYRFVLIGVGIAFAVNAGIGYLLTRSEVNDVRSALVWMVGSIGTPPWRDIAVLAVGMLVLVPLVGVSVGRLRILQLGDETAGGLGVGPERARLAVLAVAVGLAAVATAFAGPVAFVAFVSAPIARRLLPTAGLALVPSALVGTVVVLAAEFTAQNVLGALEVPVGIVTGIIGAPYLLWLLATSNRGGRGA
ncbi:iron chelate uptake ABC transporter family permease subunit [Occultella aeris]|uniref:Putative siderophore transport system permease protein YfhA n=1 Tax=Occultella aeris TaxID=2761496 RepID=A0A7M4DSL4_9MICO|nr:iron chelate uptake ABC transporter family permease subunit [Occultella aeris]VZO40458.1 putative siderophore transport system permease protein YfhA [Occultella aeris]